MNTEPPNHLDLKISFQRAVLLLEKIWHAVQGPLIVLGVTILVLASGALEWFPKWLQFCTLTILALAFLFSLKDLLAIKSASRLVAMRRMEQQSDINHRGLSGHDDDLVAETSDDHATGLWEEHKRRQLAALANVKIAPPKSA